MKAKKKYIKYIIYLFIILIIFYISNNVFFVIRERNNFFERFNSINISLNYDDLLKSLLTTSIIFLAIKLSIEEKRTKNKMKNRRNEEYGSSKWGTEEDIKPFIDKDFYNNILYTKTERLTYKTKMAEMRLNRNHNSAILGASGKGKTYLFLLPNILQAKGSMIITDTKGTTLKETGYFLSKKAGKEIKIFNTKNLKQSMHYNPFSYIETELDILKFTNILMKSTEEKGTSKGEDFWIKAERLFITALIGFMFETCSFDEINIDKFLNIINQCRSYEQENINKEQVSDKVNEMFNELEKINPNSFAVRQYKKYLTGAEKTKSTIILSACARLSVFDIQEVRELMMYDELELDTISNFKTVLFIIVSDNDNTLNFINSLLYNQLISILYKQADEDFDGEFPQPVSFYFDEFSKLKIKDFDDIISTNRSRNIPIHIMLQNEVQLKNEYKDLWTSIISNCDSFLFLGGNEKETTKEIMETLDKETIIEENSSKTYSQNTSSSHSERKVGRYLLTRGEIAKLDMTKCVYILSGLNPFLSEKIDPKEHKNYKHVYSYDKEKNKFDIYDYLKEYRNKSGILLNKDQLITTYEYEVNDKDDDIEETKKMTNKLNEMY